MSDFERLGGAPVLRALIGEFVDRVFEDSMIGFFFARANRDRIKEFEFQHAAAHLGADIRYEGRSLGVAHRPHRITGGQFARRMVILRQVMEAHGIPQDIQAAWVSHSETLRPLITDDVGSECH